MRASASRWSIPRESSAARSPRRPSSPTRSSSSSTRSSGDGVERRVELQVLAGGEVGVGERVVAGVSDGAAHVARAAREVVARDGDAAGRRSKHRREDAKERRLAGPVRARDEHGLARLHGEVEPGQGVALPEPANEALADDRLRRAHRPAPRPGTRSRSRRSSRRKAMSTRERSSSETIEFSYARSTATTASPSQ